MEKIKASELRIGNYVNAEVFTPSLIEHPIQPHDIYDIDTGDVTVYPIPLTEEWLLKLGLVYNGTSLYELPERIKDKCKPDCGFKKSAFFFNDRKDLKMWMDCQTRVCVQYVHQVQNLVFALTGEELEVKS